MNSDHQSKITVRELKAKLSNTIGYLRSKYILILTITVIGALFGLGLSWILKPKYTAVYTFALEEGGQDGLLGQYAGLASLAGFGVNNGSSIFKGDNIIELYRSRTMIKKALLSRAEFAGHNELLINRYADFNNLQQQWKKNSQAQSVVFSSDSTKVSRLQDSIISEIAALFNKKNLEVTKPDKKLSVIRIAFVSPDEEFALKFTNALVENVNRFYVQTKTKKAALNVSTLQQQADSIRLVLNQSLYGVAASLDAAPNANPAMMSLRVPSQKKQVDVQANTAIYSEIVKNLELAKMSLRQQTPLIQFIDQPVLPLEKSKFGKFKGIFIGALIFFLVTIVCLTMKKWLNLIQ